MQVIQGSTRNIRLLFPSRAKLNNKVFDYDDACWLKRRSRGTSPCSARSASQWRQALHLRFVERVVVRSEPPTAVGNDAQVAKVVSAENTPPPVRERKSRSLSRGGWFCGQPLQILMGECRGRHPWRRRMVTFTWKEALGLFLGVFFSDLLTSSTFYTCKLCEDGRMNSPRSSETCWGTCWPPPWCQRAGRWWPGFHLLCGTGTLTEADRSSYTHWHTHTHIKPIYVLHYIWAVICFYGWIMLNDFNIV